ncbi:uncharacterized protein BXZ73DRAFT_96398 [Epithele typhae]|uniref:uncharacterized protein n=1 Tax=Epithele typhae TaxID=378194 RepID=UPI0020073E89|nr:uncharacterized protein BXZ73DRAFT_96398 [Epithele typhae]KAH9945409.1 hypothetical protein BXZ73DRAFT_96398 [Epithele typhae]
MGVATATVHAVAWATILDSQRDGGYAEFDPAEVAPLMYMRGGLTIYSLGHIAVQMARAMGPSVVTLSSGSGKAALAREPGTRSTSTRGLGLDAMLLLLSLGPKPFPVSPSEPSDLCLAGLLLDVFLGSHNGVEAVGDIKSWKFSLKKAQEAFDARLTALFRAVIVPACNMHC